MEIVKTVRLIVVPRAGVEPARPLGTTDFKSAASAIPPPRHEQQNSMAGNRHQSEVSQNQRHSPESVGTTQNQGLAQIRGATQNHGRLVRLDGAKIAAPIF